MIITKTSRSLFVEPVMKCAYIEGYVLFMFFRRRFSLPLLAASFSRIKNNGKREYAFENAAPAFYINRMRHYTTHRAIPFRRFSKSCSRRLKRFRRRKKKKKNEKAHFFFARRRRRRPSQHHHFFTSPHPYPSSSSSSPSGAGRRAP